MRWFVVALAALGLMLGTNYGFRDSVTAQESKEKASAKSDEGKDKAKDKAKKKEKAAEGDKKGEGKKKNAKKADADTGLRLPRFFGRLADDSQREKILAIRAKHQPKIEELRKELAALEEKEMSEMEAVLTAAQRKELDELRASDSQDAPNAKSDPKKSKSEGKEKKKDAK